MIITRTPYRISLFGGGTDYPAWFENFGGGAVLSMTIDKYCYLTCRYWPPFFGKKTRVVWSKIEAVDREEEIEHPAVREALKFANLENGLEIIHYGDLPHKTGMGSSSAFAVGLLHAFSAVQGKAINKRQLAIDAIDLEQNKIGESVGCQDQIAAAYGGFNRINFGGTEKFEVHPISISPETKEQLQSRLMLFYTGISRTASEIAKEQIRTTAEKEKELRKMLSLVDDAEKILTSSPRELDNLGRLLHETWVLKRGLTNLVSNDHIDGIYNRAREAGAIGGKLLGAGGGGFMLFYVRPEDQKKVKESLAGILNIPFTFEDEGSKVIYSDGS